MALRSDFAEPSPAATKATRGAFTPATRCAYSVCPALSSKSPSFSAAASSSASGWSSPPAAASPTTSTSSASAASAASPPAPAT